MLAVRMSKAAIKKAALHDQDWRDFQPTTDPHTSAEKFKQALVKAQKPIKQTRKL
jgi:hypothetical protein